MIKHGASHGFSVLICTILAAFLVELLKPVVPRLIEKMSNISIPIVETLQIPLAAEVLNILLLAMILAILWGMFFKRKFVK
jgi:hypothetical protein